MEDINNTRNEVETPTAPDNQQNFENSEPVKEKKPVAMKFLYVFLGLIILGSFTYIGIHFLSEGEKESPESETVQETIYEKEIEVLEPKEEEPIEKTEDIDKKSELFVEYQENNYPRLDQDHILAGAETTSLVEGYLEILERPDSEVYGLEEATAEIPYLVITDFSDVTLQEAIINAIENGNSINRIVGNDIFFNLGCYDQSELEITGENHQGKNYIDQETQDTILNSTSENPVLLELTFGDLPATSCICCNLAHTIRIVE